VPEDLRPSAIRFAQILNRARALVSTQRFHNWQVAFPGVWKQWAARELQGGFHAIIGNPPYVRHELLGQVKPALKRAFTSYDGYADLYIYFYEQGLKLLSPGGRLSYVVTNKWLRAGYAEGLRELFAEKTWVEFVADFGHAKKFFPDADVFPSVLVVRKPLAAPPPMETLVCAIPRDDVPEKNLDEAVGNASYMLPRAHFTKDNWIIEPPPVVALFEKIKRTGISLADYTGTGPMYGIKTGFNKAFLIDTATRDRLVAEDASADEIIKPYLRGQDVARWDAANNGLWMIFARRGIDINAFPSVKRHLEGYRNRLEPRPDDWKPKWTGEKWPGRKKGTYAWYELQDAVDYWEKFSKPKIIYKVIQFYASYAFDRDGRLGNDKTFIIPTEDLSLLGILNSPLMWWFNWRHLTHLKDEALSPMGYKMERLPIAQMSQHAKEQASRHVGDIIVQTRIVGAATTSVADWLKHRFGLSKPTRVLLDFDALNAERFVAATQNALLRRRRLTAADIAEMKREYRATIEPARAARAAIFTLEQRLSELVNAAYRLTTEDVELMWKTAPPRMPFTPAGLVLEEPEDDEELDEC
jgi:Eco57I restriction-modification methylase/TaqI-like C-terminal specificity domain